MINKKERLLSRRIRRTRTSLRRNKGRRETRHPFLEAVLKENHILESMIWLR
jgi:hypothetical protein